MSFVLASTNVSQFTKIIWRVVCKIPFAQGENVVWVSHVEKTMADSLELEDSIETMLSKWLFSSSHLHRPVQTFSGLNNKSFEPASCIGPFFCSISGDIGRASINLNYWHSCDSRTNSLCWALIILKAFPYYLSVQKHERPSNLENVGTARLWHPAWFAGAWFNPRLWNMRSISDLLRSRFPD